MSDATLDDLRRDARRLHRAYIARDPGAIERIARHAPRKSTAALKRADVLHVIAQEQGFESWPRLKAAAEAQGLDRAGRIQRLKIALFHGRNEAAAALLAETPDLAVGLFGLECALYRREAVLAALVDNPALATERFGPRTPILHLAFSRWIHQRPDLAQDMLAIADALLAHGADVNDGYPVSPGADHALSALYGAIGHADNMVMAEWLLRHGADPDDGESLYHATELGHHEGLRLLLDHGADPRGTNALLRALDFNDHAAVEMLIAAGARVDDFNPAEVGGEAPRVIPALHQAARRGCDRRMVELLLDAGADPRTEWQWTRPHAFARAVGSTAVAEALEARGHGGPLSREEALLARAARGLDSPGEYIDPEQLAPAYRDILRELAHLPERLPQIRALVGLGIPYDRPDGHERVTPVQIAGWNGVPETLAYLLSLKPDLTHVNAYGGTLLSTILHGSENAPDRARRDHLACLDLVLTHGVALPRDLLSGAGRKDVAGFLGAWAARHPGQVV